MTLKKKFTLGFALIMLLALAVMGTYAYLTAEASPVTNTFTFGSVDITLDEAKVDEYGALDGDTRVDGNEYKLLPGHEYVKDPTITVGADSEDCWVFAKVEDGLADIEDDDTIEAQILANGWEKIEDGLYAQAAEAGDELVVFETFTIKGDAEVDQYGDAEIVITGYAVQKDGFDTAAAAWDATFGV